MFKKYYNIEEWEKTYENETGELKAIADYTGMPISMLVELPISLFLLFRKNAWIYNQQRSEDGRKMLKDFWRLQQTTPDMDAIHRFQKRNGGGK